MKKETTEALCAVSGRLCDRFVKSSNKIFKNCAQQHIIPNRALEDDIEVCGADPDGLRLLDTIRWIRRQAI